MFLFAGILGMLMVGATAMLAFDDTPDPVVEDPEEEDEDEPFDAETGNLLDTLFGDEDAEDAQEDTPSGDDDLGAASGDDLPSGDDLLAGASGDDIAATQDSSGDNLFLSGDDAISGLDVLSGDDALSGEDLLTEAEDTDPATSGATPGRDLLEGGAEGDSLAGGSGDDTLAGGGGADHLLGGPGDDMMLGQQGDDTLTGGGGGDLLSGGSGDDIAHGGAGGDSLTGGFGADTLFGASGDDWISGLVASLENETADLDTADQLYGGSGDDTILAGAGDTVWTGDGADEIVLGDWITSAEDAAQVVDFETGQDMLIVSYADDGPEPEITIESEAGLTRVLADGTCIATLSGADAISEDDIALLPESEALTFAA